MTHKSTIKRRKLDRYLKYLFLAFFLNIFSYGVTQAQVCTTVNTNNFDTISTFPGTGWGTMPNIQGTASWAFAASSSYPTGFSPYAGSGMAGCDIWNWSSNGIAAIYSPTLNLGSVTNGVAVSFYFLKHANYLTQAGSVLDVFVDTVATPSLSSAMLLGSFNTRIDVAPVVSSAGWYKYTVAIPASMYNNNTRVYLRSTGDWYNNLYVDEFAVVSYAPQAYQSSSAAAATSLPASAGLANQVVMALPIATTGLSANNLNVSQFLLNTAGSTNPSGDIDTASVFYTGSSKTFSTANLFGKVGNPNGSFLVTGSQNLDNVSGNCSGNDTSWFWLAYSLKSTATTGDTIKGSWDQTVINSITRIPTNTTAGSGRTIIAPLNGTYTIGTGGNYSTFNDAMDILKVAGMSGSVELAFLPGTYNGQIVVSGPVPGLSATNTLTINGVDRNTRILSDSLNQDATVVIKDISNVTFKNFTVNNFNNGQAAGIAIATSNGSGTNYLIDSNIVNLPNTGTNTSYGIIVKGDPTNFYDSNNELDSVTISANIVNGAYYGINLRGTTSGASSAKNKGHMVLNNTVNGSYYYGIRLYYIYNGIDLIGNTVDFDGSSSPYSYGVYMYYCQSFGSNKPHTVANNIIKNNGGYGMYLYYMNGSSSNKSLVYNNMIAGGFRTPSTAYGIRVSNGSNYNVLVYHNSVNIDAANTKYGFYYSGTTSGSEFKNNEFVVTATSGTAYPAYFATNPTGSNVVNYNNYLNNSTSTLIRRGSNYTSANYLSATAGGDSSYNEMPSWNALNNLTWIDGCGPKGVDLTSVVATDINGTTRATTPNLGCSEFLSNIANNLALVEILSPKPPITTGLQDLSVLVKNVGNNAITSFMVSYKRNTGSTITQTLFTNLAPCDTMSVVFTGANQINLGANNNILVYTSMPNFNNDGDATNDTIRVNYKAPLSGTYTLGSGVSNDFSSFADLSDAIENSGIGGPVEVLIDSGVYNEQFILTGPIIGSSATNTVTINGGDKNTRTITSGVSGATVLMSNTSYITVRNLTVKNTGNSNSTRAGIAFAGSVGTSNKVINCNVDIDENSGTSSNGYGIIFTGTPGGTGISAMSADSSVIDSNTVNGGGYAIIHRGSGSSSANSGLMVRNNKTTNTNYMGAYIYYNYNPVVFNYNEFNMNGDNYGYYGVYFYYNQSSNSSVSHEIIGNKVYNFGGYGMYIYRPIASSSAPKVKIHNNVIVSTDGSGSYIGYYGMYLYQASSVYEADVYHNSIVMRGSATSTNNTCFYNTGSSSTTVKNNIFVVTNGSYTPMYLNTNPSTGNVNYNIYYNSTNPTTGNLLYRSGFYNPSNFQTATAGGDTSYNVMPPFAGTMDLNITNGCLRGVNLTADVPLDVNGSTRSMAPNIGAYEYAGVALDITAEAVISPSFPITAGTHDVRVLVRNNGANTVTSFYLDYKINNGTTHTYIFSGTLASCDTVSVLFTGANAATILSGVNAFRAYTYLPNFLADGNPSNDTLDVNLSTPLSGTYTIGAAPSDFATFNDATAEMQNRGIGGQVTFNVKNGTYNETFEVPNALGLSATNNVVFKSMANNKDSVIINSGSTDATVITMAAPYVTLKHLTINATSTSNTVYAVRFNGTFDFDTIADCKITTPVYPNSTYVTYNVYATGSTANGVGIVNNDIDGGYYQIYMRGVNTTTKMNNLVVEGNNCTNAYYYPYYFYYQSRLKIRNNTFTPLGLSTYNYWYTYYCDTAFEFVGNEVNLLSQYNYVYLAMYHNYPATSNTERSLIANNVFNGGLSAIRPRIYLGYYARTIDVFNNTISTYGTSGYGASYYLGYQSFDINVKNNIFMNQGAGYAMGTYGTPNGTSVTTDNNLYYSTSNNLNYNNTTYYTSLGAWRAASSGQDLSSISALPGLNSTTLMPVASDSNVWAINSRGAFVGLNKDKVGTIRNLAMGDGAPDLGAYSVNPTSVPPLCTPIPATPVAGGTQAFLMGEDTVCTILYDAFSMVPSNVAVRQYTGATPPMIGTAAKYMKFYVDAQAPAGFYNYTMNLHYKDEWKGTVTTEPDLRLAKKNANSPWQVYLYTSSSVDTNANIISAPFLSDFSWFTGTDNLNPLPVKLMSFKGVKVNSNVNLDWATASETNAKVFEVERSFDANNYKFISGINATGNSKDVVKYAFTDRDVFTDNVNVIYYRLRIVDADGSFEYSNTVAVVNNHLESGINTVAVYPNPFTNELTINDQVGIVNHINIKDINGRDVFTQSINTTIGETKVEIPSNLQSGVYFITLNNERVIKLIKN